MRLKTLPVLAALGALALAGTARAQPPEIYPLSKVKRGQKGYGLTTRAGTTPFRFTFEVLGVSHNFIPKMDIILVKSDDPEMQHTGFWQGMSGSPLFIDGKLVCAFSYGWRFARSPVGGCTPIQYMRKDATTPRRHLEDATARGGKARTAQATGSRRLIRAGSRGSWSDWVALAPERTASSSLYSMSGPRQPWLLSAPAPARHQQPRAAEGGDDMVASAVPLALSGFTAPAFAEARAIMKGYPVEPMRAGGSGSPTEGPSKFALGTPIGVQLLRGDVSGTGTCTVSFIEGDKVLACGHPIFGAGEIYAPVTASEVHLVVPSEMSSHVVASPLRELGALVQDRQSMIMANTDLATRMIPIDFSLQNVGARGAEKKQPAESFHVEVIDNKFFTAPFAGLAAASAIARYMPDRDDATVLLHSKVYLRGKKPLEFVDYLSAETGVSGVIAGARGLRVLVPLLNNPFAPVEIERVEIQATVNYSTNFGEIDSIRLPSAELQPGKRTYVEVRMSTYNGQDVVQRVPFDVPATLAGSIVKVMVTAGDAAGVDAAPPKTLDDLLDAFRKLLPGNVFAVVVYSADEGAGISGKLVRDLPPSAADRLKLKTGVDRASTYHPASRSTYPTNRVINGSKSILVKVADRNS